MKFIFLIFFSLCFCNQLLFATGEETHPEMTISLLTTDPTTEKIYTAWGHTAVRVKIPTEEIDIVFNYGIFSFGNDFIYKFVKGETDFRLAAIHFESALAEVRDEKQVFLYEQTLNLTEAEKETLFTALLENLKPENRYYRYSFFFDNCATRPLWQIEKAVNGTIHYPMLNNTKTFRDLIYLKLADSPWYAFGIDLCLGSETDRIVTDRELLFLPEEMMSSYAGSTIEAGDSIRPLVSHTEILNYPPGVNTEKTASITGFLTPLTTGWLFFLLIVAHTLYYRYKNKNDLWLDVSLFSIYGLLGCLLFFLAFISEHACTNPNYNLLWCNPFQLIFAVLVLFRKLKKAMYCYQIVNISLLAISIVGWYFIPQHYNSAFLPFILALFIRSANYIFQSKKIVCYWKNKKNNNPLINLDVIV